MSLSGGAPVQADADERWIAVRRASEIVGVNESTVRRWVDACKIRSFRTPDQHRRIAEQDLHALVRAVPGGRTDERWQRDRRDPAVHHAGSDPR